MQNTQSESDLFVWTPVVHRWVRMVFQSVFLRPVVLLALLFAVGSNSYAQEGYSVDVAVNGQSENEKMAAYRVGFRIVLLRNSSNKNLLNGRHVRAALIEAQSYVIQSDFKIPEAGQKITSDTPLTQRVRETSEATHFLSMQFDDAIVSELIKQQQTEDLAERSAKAKSESDSEDKSELAVPATSALVWLLIEDGARIQMIGGQAGVNVVERAREIAGGIGQSLVFPRLDQTDQQLLTAEDLRSGNQERILAASERYRQPVVLTGILNRSRGREWITNWSRYHAGEVTDLSGQSASLDQSLQEGINWLAPASSVASATLGDGALGASMPVRSVGLIWINSLNSSDSYATVLRLLEGIEAIDVAYPSEVTDTGMLFSISPRSAVNDIAARASELGWLRTSGSAIGLLSQQQPDAYFDYLK